MEKVTRAPPISPTRNRLRAGLSFTPIKTEALKPIHYISGLAMGENKTFDVSVRGESRDKHSFG